MREDSIDHHAKSFFYYLCNYLLLGQEKNLIFLKENSELLDISHA